MSKLSSDQIENIIEARERGVSIGILTRRYGVGHSTITYHCDRNGVIPPKGFRVGKASISRGKALTQDELNKINELALNGDSPFIIAKKIGRPYSTVRYRLTRLSLVAESNLSVRSDEK